MRLPAKLLAGLTCAGLLWSILPTADLSAGLRAAPRAEDEHSALHEIMEKIKDNLKRLGRSLSDPSKDLSAALEYISEMERLALEAKHEQPNNLDEIPEEQHQEHLTSFRRDLIGALKVMLELELAILDGKREEAMEMLKGPLLKARKGAHKKYQKDEEHEEHEDH